MPPTRTIPPAKAVKTERTHEENQERAYIAASRRSDRSLEARVESARRASEIHKRRTGRSLRVTEQDVINEEMYEEEDDDLPMQYRRLTAHLQTGSVDFNRRLAAYLTNQVAMRSAMEQMVNNSYNQQYPDSAQFAQQRPNMFPSPMMPQPMTSSPTTFFRQAPYPNPHQQNFHQMHGHGRAYSTAAVPPSAASKSPTTPSIPQQGLASRRLSTPASLQSSASRQTDVKQEFDHQRQSQSATTGGFPPLWQDMGPFTTSLPPETMQMLAPALDPSDPFSASLMGGHGHYMPNPFYSWDNSQQQYNGKYNDQMPYQNPFGGMATTLAPSALDNNTDKLSATPTTSTLPHKSDASAPSSGLDFNFSQETKSLSGFPQHGMTPENSHGGFASGQVTPGDGFWDSFVEDGGWSEEAASG